MWVECWRLSFFLSSSSQDEHYVRPMWKATHKSWAKTTCLSSWDAFTDSDKAIWGRMYLVKIISGTTQVSNHIGLYHGKADQLFIKLFSFSFTNTQPKYIQQYRLNTRSGTQHISTSLWSIIWAVLMAQWTVICMSREGTPHHQSIVSYHLHCNCVSSGPT